MLLFIYSNFMLSVDEKRPLMILSERLQFQVAEKSWHLDLTATKWFFFFFFFFFSIDMATNDLCDSVKNLNVTDSSETSIKEKPKAAYDKAALKERWKILGNEPEQSKLKGFE